MLDKLGSSLREALRKIAMAKRIDEQTVNEVVRDIQRALIQADVKISLVKEISSRIKTRALKEKASLNPRAQVIRIVYEELMSIIGKSTDIPLRRQKIMLFGLHGSGKTLSCARLARYFQKKGLKPAVICADVYRPAAKDQLKQLCESIGVPFYGGADGGSGTQEALRIVEAGLKEFEKYDVLIVDTAGRHALEEDMIEELRRLGEVVRPDHRLLVLDASIGQLAATQAKAFDEAVGITGIIITKMDGTAKGGGALSAVAEVGAPIAFLGVGETVEDLEKFEPDRFISRLLGMGDIKSLVEKMEESLGAEAAEAATDWLRGKFTLKDLYEQLEALRKMGPLKQLFQMLPLGMFGGLPGLKLDDEAFQITDEKLHRFKVIMDSMTKEELANPKIIDRSRVLRIARGAGARTEEVNELLRYYKMMQKAIKTMRGGRLPFKLPKGLRF
ncbi:signal recognition particle protein Srp54 [Candidatus Alkanophaga liquidiphilum]|nr:Signal recognition particle GTPase [Candidatus Alkanophaga liquidiphilum]